MSTAVAVRPVATPDIHVTVSGRYTWVCAQLNCDGVHHYWRRPL